MPNPLVFPLLNWARRLRFPRLLALAGALFAITLVVPDPLPLVDELLLGLATLILANWKRRRARPGVTPDSRHGDVERPD